MKRPNKFRAKRSGGESGMSLIELMIAGFVLTVGMMGSLAMIMISIQSNSRNRFDSTGTMVAQLVMEHINTIPTNQVDTSTGLLVTKIPITDCTTASHTGQTWDVIVTGGAIGSAGAGASLNSSGDIDWTQSYAGVTTGYKMLYHSCGDVVWEARWNVQQLTTLTKLITVSSRQSGTAGKTPKSGYVFALPVTLRTISGP
ncbi:MAG: hypothetical protein HYX26_01555 [Acidobacteriales bacterium]|nr:hypothetical protein [Terriglobales bacterium]